MTGRFEYPVSSLGDGLTVESFLRSQGYSHRLIIALKKFPDGLTVDGKQVYTTHRLSPGETLTVTLPADQPSEKIVPVSMDLSVVYEDEHLLVLNKPAATPIHPSQGNHTNTLANGVAWYLGQKGEPFVFRVINRLDRDTTGLLILAKHALSACILSDMIRTRQICRTYLAAVRGDIRRLFSTGETGALPRGLTLSSDQAHAYTGTITAPIARADGSTIERNVDWEHGESACTHFHVLSYQASTDTSLIKLTLETGRTHQIRVHMSHLGFPLPGDFLYCPDYRYIGRQSLHAWKLSFRHPITKEPLAFTAAVPDDMQIFGQPDTIRSPLG